MHAEVKKCVENNDTRGLKYIFVDCLDVDPTFEKYREDYEYCKKFSGMFDMHTELTPFKTDTSQWNSQYWESLKLDLMKNFSTKRFEHMIAVARVVYAEKIARLMKEREASQRAADNRVAGSSFGGTSPQHQEMKERTAVTEAQSESRRIEERRREIERNNAKIEEEQRRQREELEAKKAKCAEQSTGENNSSKKVMGVVLVIAVVVAIMLLLKLLL